MVTLIIAEKPNVARKIAYALAEGKPVRKTIGKVSYYEFTRDGKKVIVAPAVGHLFSLAPKPRPTATRFSISNGSPSMLLKREELREGLHQSPCDPR